MEGMIDTIEGINDQIEGTVNYNVGRKNVPDDIHS